MGSDPERMMNGNAGSECRSATVKTGTGKVLVEKRDGRVVDFDPINIISAVKSAFADLDKKIGPQEEQLIRDIVNQVEAEIKDRYNGPAKIEDIQNLVEHGLIEDHLYDVARTYTNYRLNKDIERAKATDINEAVKRLVNRDEALVRENANKAIPTSTPPSAICWRARCPRRPPSPCCRMRSPTPI